MIFFRPSTVFFNPSSSEIFSRMPEKVITLGQPNSTDASIDLVILSMQKVWFSGLLNPLTKPWLPAMAQVSPYFFRIGHVSGPVSSTDFTPIAAADLQS